MLIVEPNYHLYDTQKAFNKAVLSAIRAISYSASVPRRDTCLLKRMLLMEIIFTINYDYDYVFYNLEDASDTISDLRQRFPDEIFDIYTIYEYDSEFSEYKEYAE